MSERIFPSKEILVGIDGPAKNIEGPPEAAAILVLKALDSYYASTYSAKTETELNALREELISGEKEAETCSSDLTSLNTHVESEDSVFGYALAISEPNPVSGVLLNATYFHVSLNKNDDRTLIEEPKHIVIKDNLSRDGARKLVEYLSQQFDVEDIERIYEMLQKPDNSPCNKEVLHSLMEEHLSILAERYGNRTVNFVESSFQPENIYDGGIERLARASLRKHARHQRQNTVTLQHEPHDLQGNIYYVLIEGERPVFTSDWGVKSLKILKQGPDSTETVDYDPGVETPEDNDLTSIEKNVTDVFEALEHGKQIPSEQFQFIWENRDFEIRRRDTNEISIVDEPN